MAIGIVCNDRDDLDKDAIKECLCHMEWERDNLLEISFFYFLNEDGAWKMYRKGVGIIPFNKDNNYNEFRHVKNILFLCGVFSNLGGYEGTLAGSIPFDCFGEYESKHRDYISCNLKTACAEEKLGIMKND